MALIKCPNCAQSVSDSAKTCPHCGAKLKEEPKNFYALPQIKQNELKTQYLSFGGIIPQERKDARETFFLKLKLICFFGIFFFIPGTAFFVMGFVMSPVFLIPAVIGYAISSVLVFLIIKAYKKYQTTLSKIVTERINFEKWLKDNHNLTVSWEWGSETKSYLLYKKLRQQKGVD